MHSKGHLVAYVHYPLSSESVATGSVPHDPLAPKALIHVAYAHYPLSSGSPAVGSVSHDAVALKALILVAYTHYLLSSIAFTKMDDLQEPMASASHPFW